MANVAKKDSLKHRGHHGRQAHQRPGAAVPSAEFGFAIIEIDAQIMQAAAMLASERRRTGRKIALPDALIAATAPCWATAENQR